MFGLSPSVEIALGVASVAMFVGTLVAIPIFLVRVSDDHFVRPRQSRSLFVRALRTTIGLALVGFGVAMLVLPGQGVLTILVGLSVLDLPVKDRIVNRLLCLPRVQHAIDAIRHKAGKGSLLVPGSSRHRTTTSAA